MSQGYIVRIQNFSKHNKGGASYIVDKSGFGGISSKYRLGKVARKSAHVFNSRSAASRYASKWMGKVVPV
jgi:hypothetical protein